MYNLEKLETMGIQDTGRKTQHKNQKRGEKHIPPKPIVLQFKECSNYNWDRKHNIKLVPQDQVTYIKLTKVIDHKL